MYKVNTFFTDLQDNRWAYKAGDIFPRNGLEVSDERLKELSSNHNRRGIPLITLVKEETTEPVADFMNPPIEDETEETETVEEKPKKKRGRPRNDAE